MSPSLLLLFRFELEDTSEALSLVPKIFLSMLLVVQVDLRVAHVFINGVSLFGVQAHSSRRRCTWDMREAVYSTTWLAMICDMLRQLQKNGRACKGERMDVCAGQWPRVAWIFAVRSCFLVKSDGWDSWAATILATPCFHVQ